MFVFTCERHAEVLTFPVRCSDKIISALTQLAGEGRSKEAFLQAMRDATVGMTKLCGPSAPSSVYTTLQQVRRCYIKMTATLVCKDHSECMHNSIPLSMHVAQMMRCNMSSSVHRC